MIKCHERGLDYKKKEKLSSYEICHIPCGGKKKLVVHRRTFSIKGISQAKLQKEKMSETYTRSRK